MQEIWKFNIDQQSSVSDERMIRELVKKQEKEMGIFLSYYFKKEGAVVENVLMDGEVKITNPGKGKFQVNFDLIHYNACLNIHDQNKGKMDIDFVRDGDNVILTGPYWPERGQDEI